MEHVELEMDSLLTVEECAAILKVHPQTVYRKISIGAIKCARIGRSIRIYSAQFVYEKSADEINRQTRDYIFSGI